MVSMHLWFAFFPASLACSFPGLSSYSNGPFLAQRWSGFWPAPRPALCPDVPKLPSDGRAPTHLAAGRSGGTGAAGRTPEQSFTVGVYQHKDQDVLQVKHCLAVSVKINNPASFAYQKGFPNWCQERYKKTKKGDKFYTQFKCVVWHR